MVRYTALPGAGSARHVIYLSAALVNVLLRCPASRADLSAIAEKVRDRSNSS